MTRRIGILGGIVVCGFLMVGLSAAAPPNILIVLADDMGYGDLGCMGSKFLKTPQIDALAKSGVLCSQAYVASAVCSPSRAGLLTGRDPRRFGYQANLNAAAANYACLKSLVIGNRHCQLFLCGARRRSGMAKARRTTTRGGPVQNPNDACVESRRLTSFEENP